MNQQLIDFAEKKKSFELEIMKHQSTELKSQHSFSMGVAGARIEINVYGLDAYKPIKDRYEEFVDCGCESSIAIDVHCDDALEPKDSHELDILFSGDELICIRNDFFGSFDYRKNQGSIIITWLKPLNIQISFEAFLRCVLMHHFLENNKLALHAAGVSKEGKGFVFTGPSGSGKTTIAKLSTEHKIFSDEFVVLEKTGSGEVILHGTPFWGEMECGGRTERVRLAGILLINKSKRNEMIQLGIADGSARLMKNALSFDESEHYKKVFALSIEICESLPVYDLHFSKDIGFWECIDRSA